MTGAWPRNEVIRAAAYVIWPANRLKNGIR